MFTRCFVISYSIVSFFPLASLLNCLSEPSDPRCSSDAEFVGCYLRDCILQEYSHPSSRMDMTYCFHLCSDRHYILAGLFDGNTCLCACAISCNASLSDAKDRCGIPCAGNVGEFCGGREAVQTYKANTPSGTEETCQGVVKVTAPSSSLPSQPDSTSSILTEPAKVANHTGLPSTPAPVVLVPILASVLGASQIIRADRLGGGKPEGGQHGVLPCKVHPGEASRSSQDPHRPPCIPEYNMNLKNDDELMGHLYCDIDNVQGPSPMLTATSSPLGDYVEPGGFGGNSEAATLCPGEPGTQGVKPPVAGSLSPVTEDECLHPTYDTKMHVCKMHRSSSVYNEYETKVHKSVPSQD
eukprot:XP_011678259.1 PREDICTED: uncharacterized protein LOC105444983 [Strongylocentrotus purpuratus]